MWSLAPTQLDWRWSRPLLVKISSVVRSGAVGAALAFAFACAHETSERPVHDGRGDASQATSVRPALPLPESAFRGPDVASRGDDLGPATRFETRRIGDEAAPERRFHGAPVDLDLKGADLANVFRLLADVGHVNIVVSGEVTGTVTLRLVHVPWDQALELIVRMSNLDLSRSATGNMFLVRKPS